MARHPENYGAFYWFVDVPKTITKEGFIQLFADRVEVTSGGDLVFWRDKEGNPPTPNLVLSKGKWNYVYASSIIDGHPVAVEGGL